MNMNDLNEMWQSDCTIDDDHLDRESIKTPNLHAKYLRILMEHKLKLSALQLEYKTLRQRKFRYYRGEMPREELVEYGWNQWQGTKPLKNEMDEFLEGDTDLNKINVKCEYIKHVIDAIESIMQQIKGRDWNIRNAITWKQFISGS
jgi:hypothetical protein